MGQKKLHRKLKTNIRHKDGQVLLFFKYEAQPNKKEQIPPTKKIKTDNKLTPQQKQTTNGRYIWKNPITIEI